MWRAWVIATITACGRVHFDAADFGETPAPPPIEGLIGHWQFEEGQGTETRDSSPSGFHGTLVNGPTWVPGHVGAWALRFDGIDDYVILGDRLGMSSSFSASAWVFLEVVVSVDNRIVTHGAGPGNRNWVLRDEYGQATIEISADNTNEVARYEAGNSPLATWVHYAGVYDAAAQTLDIYRDGVLANGLPAPQVPSGIPPTSAESTFGRNGSMGDRLMNGVIDDVRIYARALSTSEIAAIYLAR